MCSISALMLAVCGPDCILCSGQILLRESELSREREGEMLKMIFAEMAFVSRKIPSGMQGALVIWWATFPSEVDTFLSVVSEVPYRS